MLQGIRLESGVELFPGYRLSEIRGRGGFAEVWESSSPQGQKIALKIFVSKQTSSTVKEIRALGELQKLYHPSLLRMHQIWSLPGYIVIAMELAEGSLLDLFDVYQSEYRTAVPAGILCDYMMQVADGLDFLNSHTHTLDGRRVGWQHCDIKPSNLLLIGDTVKIADFGISTPTTNFLTPYQRAGTLDFAAPEFHRNMLSDRSDQYSLAVTYYFLRTGRFPFPPVEKGFRREYSYSRPDPDLKDVSRTERKILERALDVQPERRWDCCHQFIAELTKAVHAPQSASSSTMISVSNSSDAKYPSPC